MKTFDENKTGIMIHQNDEIAIGLLPENCEQIFVYNKSKKAKHKNVLYVDPKTKEVIGLARLEEYQEEFKYPKNLGIGWKVYRSRI